MVEYGLFNDESADYTAEQSVEAGFYSAEDAKAALLVRYSPEDGLEVHEVVEDADDEEDEA